MNPAIEGMKKELYSFQANAKEFFENTEDKKDFYVYAGALGVTFALQVLFLIIV